MNIDAKIDDFVKRVNTTRRERIFDCDAPSSVVVGVPDDEKFPMWDWNVKRYPKIDWVEAMEASLRAPFPPAFRSLISRYIFPEFDFGGFCFLANTPEDMGPMHELRSLLIHEKHLAGFLIARNYIPFARPDTGDFDLICFDSNVGNSEFPIVRIDHESVFLCNKIRVTQTLAPDFLSWIEEN